LPQPSHLHGVDLQSLYYGKAHFHFISDCIHITSHHTTPGQPRTNDRLCLCVCVGFAFLKQVHEDTLHTELVHICHLYYFSEKADSLARQQWQAPEVICGKALVTGSADIFSFGLLIYYIIEENNPYGDSFDLHTVEQLARGWRLPIPSHFHGEITNLISKCWEMRSSARITAAQLVVELYELLDSDFCETVGLESESEFSSDVSAIGTSSL
jgi:serine/threonine protein kinase